MVQQWGAVNPKYIHFETCSINISLSGTFSTIYLTTYLLFNSVNNLLRQMVQSPILQMKKLKSERFNNFLEVAQLVTNKSRAHLGLLATSSELFVLYYRLTFQISVVFPQRARVPNACEFSKNAIFHDAFPMRNDFFSLIFHLLVFLWQFYLNDVFDQLSSFLLLKFLLRVGQLF